MQNTWRRMKHKKRANNTEISYRALPFFIYLPNKTRKNEVER